MINYFVIINMVLRYQAFSYDVHWTLSRRTQKINSWTNQKGYDNSKTTNRKLLARKIQIFWVHFCVIHFLVFFKMPFKITSEEKRTRKNWILFVESSSTKVSGPSEVPQFVRELFFGFKGIQAGVRVLENWVLAHTYM